MGNSASGEMSGSGSTREFFGLRKSSSANKAASAAASANSTPTIQPATDFISFRVYIHRRSKFVHEKPLLSPPTSSVLKVSDRCVCNGPCACTWLRVSSTDIVVEKSKSDTLAFPIRFLRRYGYTSAGVFFFESGRRCVTGEGLHTYQTQYADQIFYLVQTRVKEAAARNNEAQGPQGIQPGGSVSRECSFGGGAHTPRIHPVQRYSSEGTNELSQSERNALNNYHSLHVGENKRRKMVIPPPPRPRSLPGVEDGNTLISANGNAQIIGNIISEHVIPSSRKGSVAEVWHNGISHSYANLPGNNVDYRPRCPSVCSNQSLVSTQSTPTTPTTKVFPMQWNGGAGSTSFLCYANTMPTQHVSGGGGAAKGKYVNMQDMVVNRIGRMKISPVPESSSSSAVVYHNAIDRRPSPLPTVPLNYAAVEVPTMSEERSSSRASSLTGRASPMVNYSLIDGEKTRALQQARDDRKATQKMFRKYTVT